MYKTTLTIDGMMCPMCESHVNDAIRAAVPVRKITSSHKRGESRSSPTRRRTKRSSAPPSRPRATASCPARRFLTRKGACWEENKRDKTSVPRTFCAGRTPCYVFDQAPMFSVPDMCQSFMSMMAIMPLPMIYA